MAHTQQQKGKDEVYEFSSWDVGIVDDDADFASNLADTLRLQGYAVETANSFKSGLELLENEPQIALVDLKLDEKDGLELISRLRDRNPDTVFILMTAFSDIESSIRAVRLGIDDYLRKPIDPRMVISTVARHIETHSRKKTESERNMSDAVARDVNQLKLDFLAGVNHELRTPLHAILGYSELIQHRARGLGDHQIVEHVRKVREAGLRLLDLVGNLIDLSRYQNVETEVITETIDIGATIGNLVEAARGAIERRANKFVLDCNADIGTMQTDSAKLRRILAELLDNAAKFTQRGKITLQVSRAKTGDKSWVVFRVSDSGAGIEPARRDSIFDVFTKGDTSNTLGSEGLGSGLALCSSYARLLGGRIAVESQPGQGSTFIVTLPA